MTNRQKLSPIEKELLECYEERQPVLLYGGDSSIDLEEIKRKFGVLFEPDEDLIRSEYIDCGDMNGKEVYEKLVGDHRVSPLGGIEVFFKEGLLFSEFTHEITIIDNLHCRPSNDEDGTYYRKLGKVIKYRGIGNTPTTFNWLVAYAHDDPQNFPKYFKDQFRLIPLDRKVEETIEIDWTKLEDLTKTGEFVPFPTPQDAKWSDVEITFIDGEHVNIKVKDDIKSGVHYSQMGFKHETAPQKIKLWDTLRLFAIANGIITPRFDTKGKLIKPVSSDDVKRLRKKLKSYFGISDNPIPPYDKGTYVKDKNGDGEHIRGEGYKTSFVIKDDSALIKQKDEFIDTADIDPDY